MDLKQLIEDVHKNAVAHGWWENPRSEGELLMLVVSEISEAFEEIRDGHAITESYYSEDPKTPNNPKPEGVPSELADVIIRIMDISAYYGIDIEKAIIEKNNYNKCRPFRHGGKKL